MTLKIKHLQLVYRNAFGEKQMITDIKAKNEIIANHAKRKFGNRDGNLVRMSYKSRRFAYDEHGFCDTVMIVGCSYPCVKIGKKYARYYAANGVLAHEELV